MASVEIKFRRWLMYHKGCTPYNTRAKYLWKKGSTGSTPGGCFTVVWVDPEEPYVWGKPR